MAKPVHKDSNDCSSSSLDLFLLPLTQSSFQKGKSIDYHPITSLSDGEPIEFKASGSGKEFVDLAWSYLYLKVKVSKADGSNLNGASKVGFANYPTASLFNQVDVILGGKLIPSATNTYAHRSILEVLLNYDKEAAESQLGCGLFCKAVFNAINTVLNDKNAQYAITRTTPKVFTVPRGQPSQHIDNAFLGEIPKRIAVCMMDNDSYNGNYKKNPFNFQHYNLTQIGISVNGEEVPFKPQKLNFDDKLFVTAYNTLFSGTGKLHGNSGSIIKREDY